MMQMQREKWSITCLQSLSQGAVYNLINVQPTTSIVWQTSPDDDRRLPDVTPDLPDLTP